MPYIRMSKLSSCSEQFCRRLLFNSVDPTPLGSYYILQESPTPSRLPCSPLQTFHPVEEPTLFSLETYFCSFSKLTNKAVYSWHYAFPTSPISLSPYLRWLFAGRFTPWKNLMGREGVSVVKKGPELLTLLTSWKSTCPWYCLHQWPIDKELLGQRLQCCYGLWC